MERQAAEKTAEEKDKSRHKWIRAISQPVPPPPYFVWKPSEKEEVVEGETWAKYQKMGGDPVIHDLLPLKAPFTPKGDLVMLGPGDPGYTDPMMMVMMMMNQQGVRQDEEETVEMVPFVKPNPDTIKMAMDPAILHLVKRNQEDLLDALNFSDIDDQEFLIGKPKPAPDILHETYLQGDHHRGYGRLDPQELQGLMMAAGGVTNDYQQSPEASSPQPFTFTSANNRANTSLRNRVASQMGHLASPSTEKSKPNAPLAGSKVMQSFASFNNYTNAINSQTYKGFFDNSATGSLENFIKKQPHESVIRKTHNRGARNRGSGVAGSSRLDPQSSSFHMVTMTQQLTADNQNFASGSGAQMTGEYQNQEYTQQDTMENTAGFYLESSGWRPIDQYGNYYNRPPQTGTENANYTEYPQQQQAQRPQYDTSLYNQSLDTPNMQSKLASAFNNTSLSSSTAFSSSTHPGNNNQGAAANTLNTTFQGGNTTNTLALTYQFGNFTGYASMNNPLNASSQEGGMNTDTMAHGLASNFAALGSAPNPLNPGNQGTFTTTNTQSPFFNLLPHQRPGPFPSQQGQGSGTGGEWFGGAETTTIHGHRHRQSNSFSGPSMPFNSDNRTGFQQPNVLFTPAGVRVGKTEYHVPSSYHGQGCGHQKNTLSMSSVHSNHNRGRSLSPQKMIPLGPKAMIGSNNSSPTRVPSTMRFGAGDTPQGLGQGPARLFGAATPSQGLGQMPYFRAGTPSQGLGQAQNFPPFSFKAGVRQLFSTQNAPKDLKFGSVSGPSDKPVPHLGLNLASSLQEAERKISGSLATLSKPLRADSPAFDMPSPTPLGKARISTFLSETKAADTGEEMPNKGDKGKEEGDD